MFKISDKDVKFNMEAMKNWRKNLSKSEDPVSYHAKRCIFMLAICNNDYATHSHA